MGKKRWPSSRIRQGNNINADRIGRIATAGLTSKKSKAAAPRPSQADREKVSRTPNTRLNRDIQRVVPRKRGSGPHEAPSHRTNATTRSPPYAFGSRRVPESLK